MGAMLSLNPSALITWTMNRGFVTARSEATRQSMKSQVMERHGLRPRDDACVRRESRKDQ